MAKRRREPVWLSRLMVPGVRDENVLESALARPHQKWHYADSIDTAALGAAYAFGLVSDADVVAEIVALAEGEVAEEDLADRVRTHTTKRR